MHLDLSVLPAHLAEARLRNYRLAADQGNADAQFWMGFINDTGHSMAQNYAEAVMWYRLAADQGNAPAQKNLGIMFAEGHGVAQNHAEAVKWYRLAADNGSADAQYNLAVEYAKGQGVPQEMSDERLSAENRKIVVNELSTCWRKFSEQELSAMNGKDELVSRVQLKYGFSKEQTLRDVDALLRGRPFQNQWHFVRPEPLERERLIMPDETPCLIVS